ncbi:MAG TPA: hypothetical protein DCR44_01245 [Acholeplasmatales bacterium]|nr:hypothetical protein [Acholeplasmatales bacterium]
MHRIILENTNIKELGDRPRTIRILLPDGYDDQPEKRYPVLYMHDGQNLFDSSGYSGYSWDVARTLDRMQAAGETDGIIVVGIDNGGDHRISEYSSSIDPRAVKRIEKHFKGIALVAEGGAYGDWLVGTLKPSIDARYRTLPAQATTGIAGSSCGGNISLSIMLAHPDRFGVVGVFSPALWIIAADAFERLKQADLQGVRIYHDMGGWEETGRFESLQLTFSSLRLDRALKRRMPQNDVMRRFDPIARHTELFWQDRFPGFVRWGFGTRRSHDECMRSKEEQR